jgi:predicted nucleic acid-binding Zn ribbon protein
MPLRTYECLECKATEDVFQFASEEIFNEMKFEKCDKEICACKNRLDYTGIGIKFVGPGFYVNDYK